MNLFHLSEITTKDNLVHQGVYFEPKKKGPTALLWIHGLTSKFYGHINLLEEFARQCEKLGYGFAAFNNRGHDLVANIQKIDKKSPKGYSRVSGGSSFEVFEECIYDIQAGIDFLTTQGFTKIILIGHSSGANKVTYFSAKKKSPAIAGVILASPMSDRLVPKESTSFIQKSLSKALKFRDKGKGDLLQTDLFYFPITANRLVSLLTPNSPEDTFDYGDPHPQMQSFAKITSPLLIILAEHDEHAERPITHVQTVFDQKQKSPQYKSIIIKQALHSFGGKEKEFVKDVIAWVKTL